MTDVGITAIEGASMTRRRIGGWAVLSLIPATFIGLAALAGQLAEMTVGAVIAGFIVLAAWTGIHLIETKERR